MTFSTEVELTEIPRLLTLDLEYNPCFARYADCVHNGNPASPEVRVNPARNSQSFVL
ncbi:hypothetical protein [uncultured Muribaculum sp.]|uniref:hypothetical protein n=1 Tax=uncultured Muribaculum sp. TaxID=1918613 RepID=UPI00259AD248|nr:hypothetical protein [uncultured Muribaculum sp.]